MVFYGLSYFNNLVNTHLAVLSQWCSASLFVSKYRFPRNFKLVGGLLLPAISWVLVSRVQKRSKSESEANIVYAKNSDIGFIAAFLYGVMLSMTFINGYDEISSIMLPGILFFSIFFRVYREELILSMSFTLGAVLPMIFGTLIALLSAVVYFSMQFIWVRLKKITPCKQAH